MTKTTKIDNHRYTEYQRVSTKASAQKIARDFKARNITYVGKSRKSTMSVRVVKGAKGTNVYIIYYRRV